MRFLISYFLLGLFLPLLSLGQEVILKKIPFPNDSTKTEYEYFTLGEQKHGLYRWYYDNKQIRAIGYFKYNKTDSLFTSYFRNGHKKSEVMFKEGIMHGSYKTYFPTGKPEVRGQYENNLKNGRWVYLTEKGQTERVEIYEHGKMVSPKPKTEPIENQDSTNIQNNPDNN